jgi:DNA-binding MarR family transcriptional regulator
MATPSDLITALRRFGLENDRLDAIVARRLAAPPAEFKAMDHLHAAGELTPGQLADRLALTSGAVTALLDRLERLGWVTREPHPTDRRSVIVRRASKTSEAVAIYAGLQRRMVAAASALSAAERDAAVRFLEEAAQIARAKADELKRAGAGD